MGCDEGTEAAAWRKGCCGQGLGLREGLKEEELGGKMARALMPDFSGSWEWRGLRSDKPDWKPDLSPRPLYSCPHPHLAWSTYLPPVNSWWFQGKESH